jgi:hypothetical protein
MNKRKDEGNFLEKLISTVVLFSDADLFNYILRGGSSISIFEPDNLGSSYWFGQN